MAFPYVPVPTLRPSHDFNVSEEGTQLRTAMKGFGTDEETIINILTKRTNSERQQLVKFFLEEYGRDLIADLKSELKGNFEDLIVALCRPPFEYLCKELHKAMKGMGTDDECLIEILCTHDNKDMAEIVQTYERLYDRPLAEHVCSETSGDFRRLLTLIITGVRNASDSPTSEEEASELANRLYAAGEGKLGTDEEIFNRIFAHESFPQLRLIFEQYKTIAGRTIEQAIKSEISGNLEKALLALVECVQNPATFFARRIHEAMKGMGTNDVTLIRIIVSRSELDLGNIKQEYERIYQKTLQSAIESETSGDYKKALISLLGAYNE